MTVRKRRLENRPPPGCVVKSPLRGAPDVVIPCPLIAYLVWSDSHTVSEGGVWLPTSAWLLSLFEREMKRKRRNCVRRTSSHTKGVGYIHLRLATGETP